MTRKDASKRERILVPLAVAIIGAIAIIIAAPLGSDIIQIFYPASTPTHTPVSTITSTPVPTPTPVAPIEVAFNLESCYPSNHRSSIECDAEDNAAEFEYELVLDSEDSVGYILGLGRNVNLQPYENLHFDIEVTELPEGGQVKVELKHAGDLVAYHYVDPSSSPVELSLPIRDNPDGWIWGVAFAPEGEIVVDRLVFVLEESQGWHEGMVSLEDISLGH